MMKAWFGCVTCGFTAYSLPVIVIHWWHPHRSGHVSYSAAPGLHCHQRDSRSALANAFAFVMDPAHQVVLSCI
jgi:hypothetical protein